MLPSAPCKHKRLLEKFRESRAMKLTFPHLVYKHPRCALRSHKLFLTLLVVRETATVIPGGVTVAAPACPHCSIRRTAQAGSPGRVESLQRDGIRGDRLRSRGRDRRPRGGSAGSERRRAGSHRAAAAVIPGCPTSRRSRRGDRLPFLCQCGRAPDRGHWCLSGTIVTIPTIRSSLLHLPSHHVTRDCAEIEEPF